MDRDVIVDHTLSWMPCAGDEEAAYLLALINSDSLRDAVEPHMSRELWGARDLHSISGTCRSCASTPTTSYTARSLLRQWLADSDEGHEVERVVSELLRQVQ